MRTTLLLFASACMALTSCTKDAENNSNISDSELSTMATSDGLVMKNAIDVGNEHWNIKMNDVASKALALGSKSYPTNSLLVKEKHDETGAITGFDIMYRTSGDLRAEDGWIYDHLDANGVPTGKSYKNLNCNSCHATASRSSMH